MALHQSALLPAILSVLLAACGGGGGTEPASATLTPIPQRAVTETPPEGTITEISASDYFPMHKGDTWVFDFEDRMTGVTVRQGATRRIRTAPDAEGWQVIEKSLPDQAQPLELIYRAEPTGLVGKDPFGSPDAPGQADVLTEWLEYPSRFITGGVRRVEVQGSLGRDVDGDGHVDGFTATLVQESSLQDTRYLGRPFKVLRLKSMQTLTLIPSRADRVGLPLRSVEWTDWAAGVGQIGFAMERYDGYGTLVRSYGMTLRHATVAGRRVFGAPTFEADTLDVALPHTAVLQDASHRRYLASVPKAASGPAGWIVAINPDSGATTALFDTGGDPGPMVLAPDARSLYVGLRDTHEVVQFGLNGEVLRRTRLPTVNRAFETMALEPLHLILSPTDPDVMVVGVQSTGPDDPVLLRNMQVVPRSPDNPRIPTGMPVFASDGAVVAAPGWQEFLRFEVRPEGLVRTLHPWIAQARAPMDRAGTWIYAGPAILDERTLEVLHVFADASHCRPWPASTLSVCLNIPTQTLSLGLSLRWEDAAQDHALLAVETVPWSHLEDWDTTRDIGLTPGLDGQTLLSLHGREPGLGAGFSKLLILRNHALAGI